MTQPHYLIIGNGAAGLSAAEVIRRRDRAGRITILTDEPHLFYSRPGIAYLLTGQVKAQQLAARTAAFYREHRLDLRRGRVTGIDPVAQRAFLERGGSLAYDVLLLATGASAVIPRLPGVELDGVVTLDTLEDARRVVRQSRRAKRAVVVGGGITAMELAEGIRRQGARVHFLQRGERLWRRLFDQRESDIVAARIRHEGIDLHFREEVAEIVGSGGRVHGVRLQSGGEIACQMVAVAVGVRPNLQPVSGLSLALDRGVLVDDALQSSVPTLFAAGDVAQVYDRWTDRHHLDVLWPSAVNEGRAAGYNMVEVARGRPPRHRYQKGSPFNAALLFGIHLTVIGRVGRKVGAGDAVEISHLSRGASSVWTAPFTRSYRSAWDRRGATSLRVVACDGRVVGALLLGNQELADPLRQLIENEVDLGAYEAALLSGDDRRLPQAVLHAWRDWHQNWS